MFGIGMTEMVVIAVIALVVLGPKRLPELARTLGRTLNEFRRSATDLRREFSDVMGDPPIEPPPRLKAKADPAPGSAATGSATSGSPDAPAAPDAGDPRPGGTAGG